MNNAPTNSYECRVLSNKNLLCQVSGGFIDKQVLESASKVCHQDGGDQVAIGIFTGGIWTVINAIHSLPVPDGYDHCDATKYAAATTGAVTKGDVSGYILLKKLQ